MGKRFIEKITMQDYANRLGWKVKDIPEKLATLFHGGGHYDTLQISQMVGMPESLVYNILHKWRESL